MFFYIQKEIIMAGTSTEGVGQGSVTNIYPRILNDVVKTENLKEAGSILENLLSDITISTANGTATNMDANSITFRSGSGYAFDPAFTGGVAMADGGDINLYAGQATGEGDGGNVEIFAGNAGDGPDSNAGYVYIKGGDSNEAENSDAGDVVINAGLGIMGIGGSDGGNLFLGAGHAGDDGEGGDIIIKAGDTDNGDGSTGFVPKAGDISITAGNSEAGVVDVNGGDITILSGRGTVNGRGGDLNLQTGRGSVGDGTGRGGDVNITCGYGVGGASGRIRLLSMPVMPVYLSTTERNLNAGTATNGMFCYNSDTNNIEVYVNGAWKTVTVS